MHFLFVNFSIEIYTYVINFLLAYSIRTMKQDVAGSN
jgi:hypothetical protein